MENPDYPVVISAEGIKLKTEKMQPDQLYHCIYENKVFLFYKDEEGLLNCYEVSDPSAVSEIEKNPSEIEAVLRKFAQTTPHQEP